MATRKRGYIIDVTNTERDNYVARVVVTPHRTDGKPGVNKKLRMERNFGEHRAIGLALELLLRCRSVPTKLIATLVALKVDARK